MSTRGRAGRGALLLLAASIVLAAPSAPAPELEVVIKEVTNTTLSCPEVAVTTDSASVVGSLVSAPMVSTGAGEQEGSAWMRFIDAEEELARISEPGPASHVLIAGRSTAPVVTRAVDAWAPAALSGLVARDMAGAGAGLSSTPCPVPGTEWWFVGAGSQVGRGATLLVSNPAQEPARFDLVLYGRTGPVAALAGKGIDVAAAGHVRLRLDALAPDQELLAVNLRATNGRVAAALWDVSVPAEGVGRGVDFIPAAQPPSGDLVVAGITGGEGGRELVLVNPGSQFATVTARLLTEEGPAEIDGLATVAVPAGSVATINLARVLGGRPGSLHLVSDTPITGGVRSWWGGTPREVMWLSATPRIGGRAPLAGAAAVAAGAGLTTTVTVAAPAGDVFGTLTYSTTGARSDSIFSADGGPLGDGSLSGPEAPTAGGTAEVVELGEDAVLEQVRITVPGGSQRTITVPGLRRAAVAALSWVVDPSSGPAVVSHTTLDEDVPLATGYQWWPATSTVRALPVRADIGTLMGTP